ncbi:hypothetical protein ANCCEY_06556 [Ancylostoma ceylanicum]|uniref:Uncharacterized protein n=1 Tax=Ancylostoma ceylanicum TaxID=53326 RepID=A0A0D6LQM6_9BILA|nr:hypothetical protein ANCCEY_06556 [Ancylostoma ceylanicum]
MNKVGSLSRLVITGLPRKAIEFRRVAYGAQRSSAIVVSQAMLRRRAELGFNFSQFKVQRIVLKNFPTLVLDRCSVTTKMVCDYTEDWFASAAESEKSVRSQICTVKRCAAVKGSQFEVECRKRGLHCKRRRGSGSLILYNIQAEHAQTEFTVATQPLEADELKKADEQQ